MYKKDNFIVIRLNILLKRFSIC